MAGLGSLGLGSLITEITASEEDEEHDDDKDQAGTDAEGERKTCLSASEGRTEQSRDYRVRVTIVCLSVCLSIL